MIRNIIISIVVLLVVLYIYFQWKKKQKTTLATADSTTASSVTDSLQNPISDKSNVSPDRHDLVTGQQIIDGRVELAPGISIPAGSNDGIISTVGSSTSTNPTVRENQNPVALADLGAVGVHSVAGGIVPLPVTLNTDIPDTVLLTDGRQLISFSPITALADRKTAINNILAANPGLRNVLPSNIISALGA